MAKLIVLGSACAVPDETHENTHLALLGQDGAFILIDCAGQPVIRLRRAGLHFEGLTDLILTHFHPDHTYGVSMLIMEMWLRGRKNPLRLHGTSHCLTRIEALMKAYDWDTWPKMFPVAFFPVDNHEGAPVLESADYRILCAPVKHFVPTIGLRVEDKQTGRVLAYSCDTEPCPGDIWLARGADMVIHEVAGKGMGHTSAAQAGEIAREAGARKLVLIHYCVDGHDLSSLVPEAEAAFGGPVIRAEDFMELEW